jgi:hypothetical protein
VKFFSVILLFFGVLLSTACLTTVPELYLDPVDEEAVSTDESAVELPLAGDAALESSGVPTESAESNSTISVSSNSADSAQSNDKVLPENPAPPEPREYSLEEFEKSKSSSATTVADEPALPQAEPETAATSVSEPEPDADPDPDAETGTDADPDPDADPDAETGTDADPDPDAETGTEVETSSVLSNERGAESDPVSEPLTESPAAPEEMISHESDSPVELEATDIEPTGENTDEIQAQESVSSAPVSENEPDKQAGIDSAPPTVAFNETAEPEASESLQEKPQTISNMLIEEKKKQVNTALFVLTASILAAAMLLTIAYSRRKNPDDNLDSHAVKKRKKHSKRVDKKTKEAAMQPIAFLPSSPGILSHVFLHMYAKILGLRAVKSLGSTEEFLAKSFHLDIEILTQLQTERKSLKRKIPVLEQYLTPHLRTLTQETIEKTSRLTTLLLVVEGVIYKKEVDAIKLIMGLARIEPAKIDRLLSEYSIEVVKPGFPFLPRDSVPVPLALSNKNHISLESAYKKLPEMEFIDHAILSEILYLLSDLTEVSNQQKK